jgi:hypothetical protein
MRRSNTKRLFAADQCLCGGRTANSAGKSIDGRRAQSKRDRLVDNGNFQSLLVLLDFTLVCQNLSILSAFDTKLIRR